MTLRCPGCGYTSDLYSFGIEIKPVGEELGEVICPRCTTEESMVELYSSSENQIALPVVSLQENMGK